VLFMNGTADKLMPWGGGTVAANLGGREGRGTVLGAEASAAVWARIAVAERPTTVQLPPAVESPLTTAARTSWRAHGRTAVVLVRITGGGHLEPSMVERYGGLATDFLGRQDASVEMADEVWRFFAEQIEP
jgi:polyhydroxybutyrate depolymerase